MNERKQLIKNIILSEVPHLRYREENTVEYIENDLIIIDTWMENYGITKEEINQERQELLIEHREMVEEAYDELPLLIADSINQIDKEFTELSARLDSILLTGSKEELEELGKKIEEEKKKLEGAKARLVQLPEERAKALSYVDQALSLTSTIW